MDKIEALLQTLSHRVPVLKCRPMVEWWWSRPTPIPQGWWMPFGLTGTTLRYTQHWRPQEAWIFHMDTQSFNQLSTYHVIYNISFIYLLVKNCISIWCVMYLYLKGGGTWDWSQDPKQRSMLQKARNRGANIFQLFSNSPVWLVQR